MARSTSYNGTRCSECKTGIQLPGIPTVRGLSTDTMSCPARTQKLENGTPPMPPRYTVPNIKGCRYPMFSSRLPRGSMVVVVVDGQPSPRLDHGWQRAFEPTGKPERGEVAQGQPSITILSNLLPRSRPNDAHITPHSVQHNSFPQTTIFPLVRQFSAMVCPPTHPPTRKLIDRRTGSRQRAGKFACPTRARSRTSSTARPSSRPGSLLPGYPRSRSKASLVQNC
jgi:hypothetical protein